ncbi:unnamed protein product, partial [Amoebophrya sp. A25]
GTSKKFALTNPRRVDHERRVLELRRTLLLAPHDGRNEDHRGPVYASPLAGRTVSRMIKLSSTTRKNGCDVTSAFVFFAHIPFRFDGIVVDSIIALETLLYWKEAKLFCTKHISFLASVYGDGHRNC